MRSLVAALPAELPAAVAIVLHRTPDARSALVAILQRGTRLQVKVAEDGEVIAEGIVYVAPPDHHITVTWR